MTLELPDELMRRVKQRAAQLGRSPEQVVVDVLNVALTPATNAGAVESRTAEAATLVPFSAAVTTDPKTGLPAIESPADAPIRSMTADDFAALLERLQLEDDLERAGLPVRH
jgi:plasmid stability protein